MKLCSKETVQQEACKEWAATSADLYSWLWVLHIAQPPHDEQDRFCAVATRGFIWQELHDTYSLIQIQNIKDALYASRWPNLYSKDSCGLKDELHKASDNLSRQAAALA